jgi:hypothetical protein
MGYFVVFLMVEDRLHDLHQNSKNATRYIIEYYNIVRKCSRGIMYTTVMEEKKKNMTEGMQIIM